MPDQFLQGLRPFGAGMEAFGAELGGLAESVGELATDAKVKRLLKTSSDVLKVVGFAGALAGLIIDVAQQFDPEYQDDTDRVLGAIDRIGNRIDDLEETMTTLMDAQTRALKISDWVVATVDDVVFVQDAVDRMRTYVTAEKTAWDTLPRGGFTPAQRDAAFLPVSEAKARLDRIDADDLLRAMTNMSVAAAGSPPWLAESLFQLLYPEIDKALIYFASTISLLTVGADVYAYLVYGDAKSSASASGTWSDETATSQASRAQGIAQEDCEKILSKVIDEFTRVSDLYYNVFPAQPVAFKAYIGYVYMSGIPDGGVSVKAGWIRGWETWSIRRPKDVAQRISTPIRYNEDVVIWQETHKRFLTGWRKGVYCKTDVEQIGEKWRILPSSGNTSVTSPVRQGADVVFWQPWQDVYLTGWDGKVWASGKALDAGEMWSIKKIDGSSR